MHVAERLRLEQQSLFPDSPVRAHLEAAIAFLEGSRDTLDRELTAHVAANPARTEPASLLRSVPGVDPITVYTLLAYLRELGTLSRGQVAAMVGVAPVAAESAQSVRRSIRGEP